jgi:hypothetical protein
METFVVKQPQSSALFDLGEGHLMGPSADSPSEEDEEQYGLVEGQYEAVEEEAADAKDLSQTFKTISPTHSPRTSTSSGSNRSGSNVLPYAPDLPGSVTPKEERDASRQGGHRSSSVGKATTPHTMTPPPKREKESPPSQKKLRKPLSLSTMVSADVPEPRKTLAHVRPQIRRSKTMRKYVKSLQT